MDEARARWLRFLALQLVGAVAVIHLAVGGVKLLELAANGLLDTYLTEQVFTFPRTLLFTLSSLAILAGVVATGLGYLPRRTAYELGIAAMAVYLIGWVGWHTVLNHGAAIGAAPGAETTGHSHAGLLDTLYSHYLEPMLAAVGAAGSGTPGSGRTLLGVVSKTLELAAVAVLVALLRGDPTVAGERSPLASLFVLDLDRE